MKNINIEAGLAAFFTQDHRDCDAQWAEVEGILDSSGTEAGRDKWRVFEARMRRHFAMEEEVLFPAFNARSRMGGGGPTAIMTMEHEQMRGLLDQIGAAVESGDAEEAMNLGDTLLMLIQQHNVKEEGMLYPMAEDVLAGHWVNLATKLENY